MPWVKMAELLALAADRGRAESLAAENLRLAKLLEEQVAETRKAHSQIARLRKEGYQVLNESDAWGEGGKYSFREVEEAAQRHADRMEEGAFADPELPAPAPEIDLVTAAEMATLSEYFRPG